MKRLLLIALSLLATALPAAGGAAHEGRIAKIVLLNGTRVSEEAIRRVLLVHEGDPFREKDLEDSITYLKKWGIFSDIRVEKQRSAGGWVLTFSLPEGLTVGRIYISGNYPYLSRRLRRKIAIHPGELYEPEKAARQTRRLEEFYEREGYFGTAVTFAPEIDPQHGIAHLHYKIRKGDRYRLGDIVVEGNKAFPRGRFVSALNPLFPYRPPHLKRALQKIRENYRSRGYFEARVRIVGITPDESRKRVSLRLEVTEGEHAVLRFQGNHQIRVATLKNSLPVITEGDLSLSGVEAGAVALEELYHRRGFLEAKVRGKKEPLGQHRVRLTFFISEGPQTRVKEIRIENNRRVSDRKIKKTLLTQEETIFQNNPYRPETVLEDARRLPLFYQRWGFPKASIQNPPTELNATRDKAIVRFTVEEGEAAHVGSIRFAGNERFPDARLKKLLKMEPGDLLDQEILQEDRNAILTFYADRGYPYAELGETLSGEPETLTLEYQVAEGSKAKVGEILMVGNQRTSRKAMEKMVGLKRGRSFSYRKLLQSESSLRKTGVFRSVDIDPLGLNEKREEISLVVKVEENPLAFLDLEASYDTDDKFAATTVLQHNNLFGLAKRGNIRLTAGQDIQKGELNMIDPRLFGFNLESTTGASFAAEQRPGFDAIDVGGKLSLFREFTAHLGLLTKYEITRTTFQNVTDPTGLSERDHTISKVGLSFNYDTRDSFSDPRRGITLLTGADVSTKIIASGFNFVNPKGSIASYHSLGGRFTLLNYLRTEGIHVFGGDVLTRDARLFLGGDYSVRGFAQDAVGPADAGGVPTGGLLLLLHSTEIQMKLKGNFKLAAFVDNGSVTNNFSEVSLASWRHSAGGGLRYVTPIGPIRLDYGAKLDRRPGEAFGRLHFAFGYAF